MAFRCWPTARAERRPLPPAPGASSVLAFRTAKQQSCARRCSAARDTYDLLRCVLHFFAGLFDRLARFIHGLLRALFGFLNRFVQLLARCFIFLAALSENERRGQHGPDNQVFHFVFLCYSGCAGVCTVQVQPRKRNKMSSTGMGTPSSHNNIHPTLPAVCFLIVLSFMRDHL